ncbi:MAG: hypothetical protein ABFS42_10135 [Candidatus Krumholzibacteriota bacterium]
MKNLKKFPRMLVPILILGGLLFLFGCSEETPLEPASSTAPGLLTEGMDKDVDNEFQDGSIIPADLADIDCFGSPLTCWPYTGAKLDGVPMDPVNLIFTGFADPVQIRAALLGLDGDRSVLGLEDAYPFNQVWKDALGGGVQSNYEAEGGWRGSVIQLTLGDYDPVRFHLRLFRTGAVSADGSPITIGAAHFEVLIPGTTDHQVLSWDAAKDIVVGDMTRTGLVNPVTDLMPSGPITPTPTFRYIIPAVYNGLPPELLAIVGGPPPPVDDPVGIPTDGQAMIVHLAGPATVTMGETGSAATIEFGQFVPRPYCSSGPYDWLWIEGPVDFYNTAMVDEFGQFSYQGGYTGNIIAVPVDIGTGQPVGPPFSAEVNGNQHGFMTMTGARVRAQDKKITFEDGAPQREHVQIMIGENGADKFRAQYKCLDGD